MRRTVFLLAFNFLWDLNSGFNTYKAGALLLKPHLQSILLWLSWGWGSLELFAWAGLET
jgi:hypothetical protein